MTYTPFYPDTFLTTTLPHIHPRPTDPYEAALHIRDLAYTFEELHLNFIEQYHQDIENISSENCESTEYQLTKTTKTTSKVNIVKLREDLHKKLVYLRATNAEKFLG